MKMNFIIRIVELAILLFQKVSVLREELTQFGMLKSIDAIIYIDPFNKNTLFKNI